MKIINCKLTANTIDGTYHNLPPTVDIFGNYSLSGCFFRMQIDINIFDECLNISPTIIQESKDSTKKSHWSCSLHGAMHTMYNSTYWTSYMSESHFAPYLEVLVISFIYFDLIVGGT